MCGITKIAFDFKRVIFLSLNEKKSFIARLKLKTFKESADYIAAGEDYYYLRTYRKGVFLIA